MGHPRRIEVAVPIDGQVVHYLWEFGGKFFCAGVCVSESEFLSETLSAKGGNNAWRPNVQTIVHTKRLGVVTCKLHRNAF